MGLDDSYDSKRNHFNVNNLNINKYLFCTTVGHIINFSKKPLFLRSFYSYTYILICFVSLKLVHYIFLIFFK